jgi:poly(A) polymerase
MQIFGLGPCAAVGQLKSAVKEAILDGVIPNEYEAALAHIMQLAKKMGLTPQNDN